MKDVLIENGFKQESELPEVLSVKELCEWLNVSPAWVSMNKNKLNIPHFDFGGDKFYKKDIEKWIEERKENTQTEQQEVKTRISNTKKLRIV